MWENQEEHRQLADQLVEKIRNDYEAHKERFLRHASEYNQPEYNDIQEEEVIATFALESAILNWVWHAIISHKSAYLFNSAIRMNGDQAIYYCTKIDIGIFMKDDFVIRLFAYVNSTSRLGLLYTISDENICHRLISILDRVKNDIDEL